jgi:hypothetical protein
MVMAARLRKYGRSAYLFACVQHSIERAASSEQSKRCRWVRWEEGSKEGRQAGRQASRLTAI